jgi:hypothetical protein
MTIKFNCPTCGIELEVPDEAAGRSGRCSECDNPIVVPTPVRPPGPSGEGGTGASQSGESRTQPQKSSAEGASQRLPHERKPARESGPPGSAGQAAQQQQRAAVHEEAVDDLANLDDEEPLSEEDFSGASLDEMLADEFSRVLDVGDELQPEKDWTQTRIFRGISAGVALLGIAWIVMNTGVYGYFDVITAPQEYTLQQFHDALGDLGLAGAANQLLIGISGVLMVIGGLLGLAMRNSARKAMMWGLGLLVIAEVAYVAANFIGPLEPYVVEQENAITMAVAAAVIGVPILLFLKQADRILEQAQADEFANIIPLVERILTKAFESRASDVHIEPTTQGTVVRYRIDGILHTAVT